MSVGHVEDAMENWFCEAWEDLISGKDIGRIDEFFKLEQAELITHLTFCETCAKILVRIEPMAMVLATKGYLVSLTSQAFAELIQKVRANAKKTGLNGDEDDIC